MASGAGSSSNGRGDARLAVLTPEDQQLVWTLATLLLDVTDDFGEAVGKFLVEQKLPQLPKDQPMIDGVAAHGAADAREVLITLRSGMNPDAHVPPVEALAHARYMKSRGIGLSTMIQIYQYGFAMFRDVLMLELQEHTRDRAQLERIGGAADAYAFPFVATTLQRLAYEYGSDKQAWVPSSQDPILGDPDAWEAARRLREEKMARGQWVASSPERSGAREDARRALDEFAETLASGVRDRGLHDRLALASTTITITLSDEPGLSLTLLLDRSPIEIVDGTADAESTIAMPSVDIPRIWSPDFYLPMSIAKGRATVTGPVRKFLRIVPIMRTVGEAPTADAIPDHD